MSYDELQEWIKSAKKVDVSREEEDRGNIYYTNVYEKDGRLYELGFFNGSPIGEYNPQDWSYYHTTYGKYKNYIPKEVVKKTRLIEETYYEPIRETKA